MNLSIRKIFIFFGIVGIFTGVVIWGFILYLLCNDDLDPFIGAAKRKLGIFKYKYVPPLSESIKHPEPDLNNFPKDLDDLIIVAHYDDETLTNAGFIFEEIKAGKKVGIVIVTYSQGADRDHRNWYGVSRNYWPQQWQLIYGITIKPEDVSYYGNLRESETEKVLDDLQILKTNRIYLRYPDLYTERILETPQKYWQADYYDPTSSKVELYNGQVLKDSLRNIITHSKPKRIITHFIDDTNSDHRATGRLVDVILQEKNINNIEVWNFLTHWNNHDAGWAPIEYNSEYAWLQVEPQDQYNIPEGSPKEFTGSREVKVFFEPKNFLTWKRSLLSNYKSQIKHDMNLVPFFTKRNEIFFDRINKKIIEYQFTE